MLAHNDLLALDDERRRRSALGATSVSLLRGLSPCVSPSNGFLERDCVRDIETIAP
jgi:hypothetical protein